MALHTFSPSLKLLRQSQRSRSVNGSSPGSMSVGFQPGRYTSNFALLARILDDEDFALGYVTPEHIARGKLNSSQGCAAAQWCYDIFGPDCYARVGGVSKKSQRRIAVTDFRARLRYSWPLAKAGFSPKKFDEKRGKPGHIIVSEVKAAVCDPRPLDLEWQEWNKVHAKDWREQRACVKQPETETAAAADPTPKAQKKRAAPTRKWSTT